MQGRSFHEVVVAVARGLSLEEGLDPVLGALLGGAGEVLRFDAEAFWELDFASGRVFCRTARGLPGEYQAAISRHYEGVPSIDETIVADLRLGEPVLVEDTRQDPRVHPLVARAGFLSILFAPVMAADVPRGVLAFYSRTPRRREEVDLEAAMTFAAITGVSLRYGAMYDNQARALAEARLLLQSSEAITSSLSLDEILDEILAMCPRTLGFSGCRIFLERDGGLTQVRPAGERSEVTEALRRALEAVEPQEIEGPALAVPLVVKGRPVGLFVVGKEDGGFGREDLRILKGMARHAAVAIENARLVEGLEALTSTLEDRVLERTWELERAQEELLRSERMASLGRLAATVAHELRNPLAVIRTSAFYLRNRLKDQGERVSRHLELIESQVHLSGKIVSDLLDFSRDAVPDRASVDLNRLLEGVLERVGLPEGVELALELDRDLPEVSADPLQIEQSVRNLVHNALEAMPSGGRLTLRTSVDTTAAVVEVADTGVGIPEEDRERIFDPLYTTRPEGCGLGLTLTRKLVRGHGGGLEFSSTVGRGTTFRILLPLQAPA